MLTKLFAIVQKSSLQTDSSCQSLCSSQCTRCRSNNNAIRSERTLWHRVCFCQLQNVIHV